MMAECEVCEQVAVARAVGGPENVSMLLCRGHLDELEGYDDWYGFLFDIGYRG